MNGMQTVLRCQLIRLLTIYIFVIAGSPQKATAQTEATKPPSTVGEITITEFMPRSRIITPASKVDAARFPVVDVHTHFMYRTRHDPEALKQLIAMMDSNNVAICVSLDGKLGEPLDKHIEYLWSDFKDRFVIYANIDFRGSGSSDDPTTWACNQPNFVRHTCEQLREAHDRGISGLKFFKQFGLEYRNGDGSLIRIDDDRFDPIWTLCGELKIPIIMHTADPSAFFLPIDAYNERAEELIRHPDWSYFGKDVPPRDELHAARNRVIEKFPSTTFIAAHLGNDGEDLQQAAQWLDAYPNLMVEFASRISELGRQPYSAREFIIRYQDRIMFGTDGPWSAERLQYYWRFLETHDEWFPYSEKQPPPQGQWNIFGVDLPDEVLRKIYHQNAEKTIPGVSERLAKWQNRIAR